MQIMQLKNEIAVLKNSQSTKIEAAMQERNRKASQVQSQDKYKQSLQRPEDGGQYAGEHLEVEEITDLNQTQEIRGHQAHGSNKKPNTAIGNNQKVVKLVKNKNMPEEFFKPA